MQHLDNKVCKATLQRSTIPIVNNLWLFLQSNMEKELFSQIIEGSPCNTAVSQWGRMDQLTSSPSWNTEPVLHTLAKPLQLHAPNARAHPLDFGVLDWCWKGKRSLWCVGEGKPNSNPGSTVHETTLKIRACFQECGWVRAAAAREGTFNWSSRLGVCYCQSLTFLCAFLPPLFSSSWMTEVIFLCQR